MRMAKYLSCVVLHLCLVAYSVAQTSADTLTLCTINVNVSNEVGPVSSMNAVVLVDNHYSVEAGNRWGGAVTLQFAWETNANYTLRCSNQQHYPKEVTISKYHCRENGGVAINVTLNPKKEHQIPGVTIPVDWEAWDRRSDVR